MHSFRGVLRGGLRAAGRILLWCLTRFLYRLRVHGSDRIPGEGGAVLFAEHLSFGDPFLISASLRRPVWHLLWRGYLGAHGPALLTRILEVIPIAGTDPPRRFAEALRKARERVRAGHLVCIFGEGIATRGAAAGRLTRGLERILRGTGAPVIPVVVGRDWGGLSRFRNGKFSWRWPPRLPLPVTVAFGEPLRAPRGTADIRRAAEELHLEAIGRRRRPAGSLPAHFIETARGRPFTFAVCDHTGGALSFRKALAAALALRSRLKRLLGPDPNVGILLPPSTGAALANVALSMLGRVAVNLNYTSGPELAERCRKKAGVRSVLTSRAFLSKLGWPGQPDMVFLEEVSATITPGARLAAYLAAQVLPSPILKRLYLTARDPDAPAVILFSSGTTAEPKGVVLSHFNILSNVQALDQVFELSRRDRVVGVLPFFHAFGLTTSVWLPLIAGFGAIYHPNPLDARGVGRVIRERRGTLSMAPPTFFQLYVRQCPRDDFRTLRYAVSGAEKLRPELVREFESKFSLPLLEGYGCTELSPVAAVNVYEAGTGQEACLRGSIGRPLPGVAVKVVDPESGEELPPGAEGLLLVRGPNVMQGYLDEPEMTRQAVRDGWYVTGDVARVDADGFIEITDRLARFSKIAGEMVPHGRIEEALTAAGPGVDFAVASLESGTRVERLVVVHTPLPTGLTPDLLAQKVRAAGIPNLWAPRPDAFVEVEAIPRTGTGKLELRAVREIARERLGATAR